MPEPKRCYKCGRVRCKVCHGTGLVCGRDCVRDCPFGKYPSECRCYVPCYHCKDGWREAEPCPAAKTSGPVHAMFECGACKHNCPRMWGLGVVAGTDPAILCPKCEEAA
jgi:hypothetical protein